MGSCLFSQSSNLDDFDCQIVDQRYFEFGRVVGQGGFGTVHAGMRKTDGTWFAIKEMSKRKLIDDHAANILMNERKILINTNSNFIIRLFHAFQNEQSCFFVMDFLGGGSLRYFLKKNGKTSEDHAKFYLVGILLGIKHLHERNILHRDIKLDNVMLDNNGYPRLIDLGLAVQCTSKPLKCNFGSGTRRYKSPEMYTQSKEHGIEADIWMSGLLFYELLFCGLPHLRVPDHYVNYIVQHHPFYTDKQKEYELTRVSKHFENGTKDKDDFFSDYLESEKNSASDHEIVSYLPLPNNISNEENLFCCGNQKIDHGEWTCLPSGDRVHIPRDISSHLSIKCIHFLRQVLDIRPWSRLGHIGGVDEVLTHQLFQNYDFEKMMDLTLVPPYCPKRNEGNFETHASDLEQIIGFGEEKKPKYTLTLSEQQLFQDFDYNTFIAENLTLS